jgi:AraC-like DNA-binding protein
LKQAERLLKSKGKTIAEISYEVGFSSPSYFSKCYKEYFGLLPGEVK